MIHRVLRPGGLPPAVFLLALHTSCGSLKVEHYDPLMPATDGVVFYMPQQEFVITENGVDKDGKPVGADQSRLVVSLVTKRDMTRAFSVRNRPAWFSDSSFVVSRAPDGSLTSTSGGSTGKADQVVTALASALVPALAREEKVEDELEKQKAVEQKLLEALGTSTTPADIEQTQKALALTRERIQALVKASAPAVGERPSRTLRPFLDYAKTAEEAVQMGTQFPANEIHVILVPIEPPASGGAQ